MRQARELDCQLHGQSSRPNPLDKPHNRIDVAEALAAAIEHSDSANEEWRYRRSLAARYFTDWLCDNPRTMHLEYWDEIDQGVLWDYACYLAGRGTVGRATARNYIGAIVTTSRWWHARDNKSYLPLAMPKHKCLRKTRGEEPDKCYAPIETIDELVELALAGIGEKKKTVMRMAAIGLMVGAHTGMNLEEIAGIHKEHIDFQNWTIDVKRAKTVYRPRLIPVCGKIIRFLRDEYASRGIDGQGWLITRSDGSRGGGEATLGRTMKRVLDYARKNAKDASRFNFRPKDVRKVFVNSLAEKSHVATELMRSYIGHAPVGTLDRHYRDLRQLAKWRDEVVALIWAGDAYPPATGKKLVKRQVAGDAKSLLVRAARMVEGGGFEPP